MGKKEWAIHGCFNGMLGSGEAGKGETGEKQSQDHAHHFPWHHEVCSQRILSGRPNSQFLILLWRFTATAWIFVKTSTRNLGTKTGSCITTTHLTLPFSLGNYDKKQQDCRPTPNKPFSVFPIEDKTEGPPFWNNLSDRGRIAGGAEHPHKARIPECIKIEGGLGTVQTRRREILRDWWWPVGRNLVFDQMAAPVPEICKSININDDNHIPF
jgi:hypothetical protein